MFAPRVRARGREYPRDRRVHDVVVAPDKVTARVDGSQPYDITWQRVDGCRVRRRGS